MITLRPMLNWAMLCYIFDATDKNPASEIHVFGNFFSNGSYPSFATDLSPIDHAIF